MARPGGSAWRLPGLPMLVVAVAVGSVPTATAQQFVTTGRDTLRGLPGVEVVVEPFAPELDRDGLTVEAVRRAVDGQLRAAGVPIFASQRSNTSPAQPYLYIAVTGLRFDGGAAWALALQVEVRQSVRSAVTESRIVDAVTWDQHTVLVVPTRQLPSVREEITTLVTSFVDDWHATHTAASPVSPSR